MPPWYKDLLSNLKNLVNVDVKDFLKSEVNNYHITVNLQAPLIQVDPKTKKAIINLGALPPEFPREKIQQLIRDAVLKEDHLLIEEHAAQTIDEFRQTETETNVLSVLKELTEYVTPTDLIILRASLYLREKFKKGESIKTLKEDIIYRYGDRGRKITNLCSAGYFEKTIIPLLKEMKTDHRFSKEKFIQTYNLIVEESGFAVFVSGRMGDAKVESEIVDKIKSNIKYGVPFIHIHGLGTENIKKIRSAIDGKLVKMTGVEKTSDEKTGNAIYIRLELDPDKFEAA